jgi:hypothetical protein
MYSIAVVAFLAGSGSIARRVPALQDCTSMVPFRFSTYVTPGSHECSMSIVVSHERYPHRESVRPATNYETADRIIRACELM